MLKTKVAEKLESLFEQNGKTVDGMAVLDWIEDQKSVLGISNEDTTLHNNTLDAVFCVFFEDIEDEDGFWRTATEIQAVSIRNNHYELNIVY